MRVLWGSAGIVIAAFLCTYLGIMLFLSQLITLMLPKPFKWLGRYVVFNIRQIGCLHTQNIRAGAFIMKLIKVVAGEVVSQFLRSFYFPCSCGDIGNEFPLLTTQCEEGLTELHALNLL